MHKTQNLILNLFNSDKSDIIYEISNFPDSQRSVEILSDVKNLNVTISRSIKKFRDLELVICANQTLRHLGVKEVFLYAPYLIGTRSDRRFHPRGIHYIKDVIAPIINSQKFDSVMVLDPHSDVLEACIDNFVGLNNYHIVKEALIKIDNKDGARNRLYIVSPDAGAMKKIYGVAKEFDIENILCANKVRDIKTGRIVRTDLPDHKTESIENYVIIDDICDGGRTFCELAKIIKEKNPTSKIHLIVSHAIFSSGLSELEKYFYSIHTTNSYVNMQSVDTANGQTMYRILDEYGNLKSVGHSDMKIKIQEIV